MEMEESGIIRIRTEVVWSWFGCKERIGCLRIVEMITSDMARSVGDRRL